MGHVMQRMPVLQASSWTHRNRDIGVSGFERSVDAMTNSTIVQQFFDSYTRALLGRDSKAIAEHYAVPALIEFPERPIRPSSSSPGHSASTRPSPPLTQPSRSLLRPGTASGLTSPGPTTPAYRVSTSSTNSSATVRAGRSPF